MSEPKTGRLRSASFEWNIGDEGLAGDGASEREDGAVVPLDYLKRYSEQALKMR